MLILTREQTTAKRFWRKEAQYLEKMNRQYINWYFYILAHVPLTGKWDLSQKKNITNALDFSPRSAHVGANENVP